MIDCNKIQTLLIDFVDKNLDKEKTQLVASHLESCKNCREEADNLIVFFDVMNSVEDEQPDTILKEGFEAMLEAEKQNSTSGKKIEMTKTGTKRWFYNPFSQIAAGVALLIAGMLLGFVINKNTGSNQQVAELKSEVNAVKDLLIMTKLEQPVASERIIAASYLEEMTSPDNNVLEALIKTMNNDKNSNVRLAAINALSKFRSNQLVKDAFVETLSYQSDPIIQISLINILIDIQDTRAVDKMKEMLQDNSTNESVKKLAEQGILTLI